MSGLLDRLPQGTIPFSRGASISEAIYVASLQLLVIAGASSFASAQSFFKQERTRQVYSPKHASPSQKLVERVMVGEIIWVPVFSSQFSSVSFMGFPSLS